MAVPALDKSLLARIRNNADHQHTDHLDLLLHIALTLDALLEQMTGTRGAMGEYDEAATK